MGGKVFDDYKLPDGSTPRVPRMSPELYRRMIAHCQPKLESLYRNVVIPRDAPSKQDHGDIDFLVEGIIHSAPDELLWDQVKANLGARIHIGRNQSRSFGIPHPDEPGAFVQVDVELSPGNGTPNAAGLFEWTKFMKGDADLLQIIGIAHRPLGLTCNDQGLHVRLEQIEPYDKKKALLFLTRDPDAAMHFYGLDIAKYKDGFSSETELFDWVSAGRFFSPETLEQLVEKSDDRSRRLKRPMYRHFVEDYIPQTTRVASNHWTREEVLREAIETFGVQTTYDAMMAEHRAEETEKALWKEVKATIPAEDKALKAAIRALKRWVNFDHFKPQISDRPIPHDKYCRWSAHVGQDNQSAVLAWVELNWQLVKSRDRAYDKHHGHSLLGPYSA